MNPELLKSLETNQATQLMDTLGMGDMSSTTLILAFFFGLVGFSYFVYGKKQGNFPILASGVALMVYPYFVASATVSLILGVAISAAPFLLKKFL